MRRQDLPSIDSVAKREIGVVVEVDETDGCIPFWTEMGGGMVTIVRYKDRVYLATRLSPDLAALVAIEFEET